MDNGILDITWEEFINWILTTGVHFLVVIAISWVIIHITKRIVRRVVSKSVELDKTTNSERGRELRQQTLERVLNSIIRFFIFFAATLSILAEFGIDLGPVLAGAGILSLAVGIGSQSLVKDMVAGLFILFENQYRVGDVVEIEGALGTVENLTLRVTQVRTLQGDVHFIPNGTIKQAVNKTKEYSAVVVELKVPSDVEIENIIEIINKTGERLANDKEWKEDIIEPPKFYMVTDMTGGSVEVKIVGKTKPNKQWLVGSQMRRRLVTELEKEKIKIK